MTHSTPDVVHHRPNGVSHPSQLSRDLDALMEHLDAVQPEHDAPRPVAVIEAVHVKTPRLWDRLKDAARQWVHPAGVPEKPALEPPTPPIRHGLPVAPQKRQQALPVQPQPETAPVPCTPPSATHARAFSINGHVIRQQDGLHRLHDLYQFSCPGTNHTPKNFLRSAEGKAALRALNALAPDARAFKDIRGIIFGSAALLLAYADWCGKGDALKPHAGGVGAESDAISHGELSINGTRIRHQPRYQLYSLSDLHKSSGSGSHRRPLKFLEQRDVQTLISTLSKEHATHTLLKTGTPGARGTGGMVWACRDIALAYADWLGGSFLDAVRAALSVEDARLEVAVETPPPTAEPLKLGQTFNQEKHLVPAAEIPLAPATSTRLSVNVGISLGSVKMTSGEIAELVNSRHDHVRRSIDRLVKKGAIRQPPTGFSEKFNNFGGCQIVRHYVFSGEQGRRDSTVVVAQLSPESVERLNEWWNEATANCKNENGITENVVSRLPAPSSASLDCIQIDADALSGELTMSSLDIAELARKQHRNVLRDIREMLTELYGEGGMLKFEHTHVNPQNNRAYPIFKLPKDLTLTLVAGYSVVLRKRIIDRWLELERCAAISTFGVPQTLQDALRMAADLLDENQTLRLENQSLKQITDPSRAEKAGDLSSALSTRELARMLDIKLTDLCRFLREDGLLKKSGSSHVPAPRALSDGLFAFRPLPQRHNAPYMQPVATEKGLAYIRQRLAECGLPPKTPARHLSHSHE